jgi:ATP-dependent DNA helicase RecG
MTKDELLKRLSGIEWNDWEVKEAAHAVPKSAYESVSAFANTAGGYLVFGVKQTGLQFEVKGVIEVEKVHSDFVNTLNGAEKLSKIIDATCDHLDCNGDKVLVFYIPEAHRYEKPVFLNGDMTKAFVARST